MHIHESLGEGAREGDIHQSAHTSPIFVLLLKYLPSPGLLVLVWRLGPSIRLASGNVESMRSRSTLEVPTRQPVAKEMCRRRSMKYRVVGCSFTHHPIR